MLMAMPAAQGLFHKAIVQSGSMLRVRTPESASAATHEALRALNLDAKQVDRLGQVPSDELLRAYVQALKAGHQFIPVVDGDTLLQHPFEPTAPSVSANEIGSASCRARVCQYGLFSVVAVSLKTKTNKL